ncbi:putative allantoin permease [Cylindrobasidium torrendii FP15055 ss-10]|uniref:Putative allantoin permease n=1 Tax=Cylindrobasidium torrendii FP15055 ss-10 TaxID=1314674 RepID=A0A0D7BIH2_9AGAR|nr:putative allantoin permease [Cylindrobasidium torrendii FP15055 ss-10]
MASILQGSRSKATEAGRKAKVAFSSWSAFKKALEVERSDGFARETGGWMVWSNKHNDPSPPEDRTWTWFHFTCLWSAYGFSTGVWSIGSSMISAGLTPGQAVAFAHLLGSIAIVLNSHFAAAYHVGYPVMQRVAFGMWGSFVPVLLRCLCGIVWTGVQIAQGGYFTAVMLRCIFGHYFTELTNHIPEKAGVTSQQMVGIFVFWIATLPFLYIKPHNTRYLWVIKVALLPPAVIGLFIYCMRLSPGGAATFAATKHYTGSKLAWTMLSLINSAMGKTSTSQVNAPDLSRYAKTRVSPIWSQLLSLPIINTAVACFGIFATASIQRAWGKTLWAPWLVCGAVLDHHNTPAAKFAIFLVSAAFTLSILSNSVVSNQAANVIPFGADMSGLFAKWLDINRGQLLAYCLGLAINPWYILASADSFLTFLGGYSIFLGSIVGVSVVDYFWRRGNIDVKGMYDGSASSPYWYWYGINWRAMSAFIIGFAPTLPGFAGSFGHVVPIGWIFSTVVGAFVYWVFNIALPPTCITEARQAPFQTWADEQKELMDRVVLPNATPSVTTSEHEKDMDISVHAV